MKRRGEKERERRNGKKRKKREEKGEKEGREILISLTLFLVGDA